MFFKISEAFFGVGEKTPARPARGSVRGGDGKPIKLTPKSFDITFGTGIPPSRRRH